MLQQQSTNLWIAEVYVSLYAKLFVLATISSIDYGSTAGLDVDDAKVQSRWKASADGYPISSETSLVQIQINNHPGRWGYA